MGYSESNRSFLQVARESSEGTLPGSPVVHAYEYNPGGLTGFAPQIESVEREPVSPANQRQRGMPVDKMVEGSIETDLTWSTFREFAEGLLHAAFTGPAPNFPTSCTTAHFVVPTMSAALPANTLVFVRGAKIAANNGFKVVDSGGTTTQIPIVGGLVAETFAAAEGATVEVCGFRFASGDLQVNSDGNLITTTKDLTQLGLEAGDTIWVGGVAAAQTFAVAANRGPARIAATPTANLMRIENTTAPFTVDNGSSKLIDVFYGQRVRVRYLTDANFLLPYWRTERVFNKLGAGDAASYLYAHGMQVVRGTISMPEKAKATLSVAMRGTTTSGPTTSRATNFNAPIKTLQKTMVNTTSHIYRGRIRAKVAGTAFTGIITSVALNLEADVQRNGGHGVMGSVTNTAGPVNVGVEVGAHFTVPEVIAALEAGDAVGCDWFINNGDGAACFDMPSCTLSNGMPETPTNQTVRIALGADAHEDDIFGSTLIVSLFPYCPTA